MIRRSEYWALADLRYHLRRFLRVRELAARKIGVAPQHYQLLLELKGLAGRRPATVGALAERLQIHHHSAVGLIDRLAARGLIRRRSVRGDRRHVVIELRPAGEDVLRRLALYSLSELRREGPALVDALARLFGGITRRTTPKEDPHAQLTAVQKRRSSHRGDDGDGRRLRVRTARGDNHGDGAGSIHAVVNQSRRSRR